MRYILFLLSVVILNGCNQSANKSQEKKDKGFTFAFLTDIHLQPEKSAVAGFQQVIDTLNILNPDFVITGGDLVMDVLNQSYVRADSLYNLYKKVSGGLDMPVYNTVGNHEVYGWHRNEEGIEEHSEYGKKMFEKRIGERYYSFDHKGWHFMVMDAVCRGEDGNYVGGIDKEQIGWLKKDLEKLDKETPIIISVHIPFITSQTQLTKGSLAANPEGLVIANARDVLLHFWDYNLKLVLQGHLHFLEDIYVNNQVHFITGGAVSGKWWSNKRESTPEGGFQMVHVEGDRLDWEYVDYGWTSPVEN